MSGRGVGKVVDVQSGRAGQKEQEGKDMVVVWRAAVVRTCEMGRKMDFFFFFFFLYTRIFLPPMRTLPLGHP